MMRITPARLKHPEIPFPSMVIRRAIPGTELRVGDPYPDPGADKKARRRAALYFDQRRITPLVAVETVPNPAKEKKHGPRKA